MNFNLKTGGYIVPILFIVGGLAMIVFGIKSIPKNEVKKTETPAPKEESPLPVDATKPVSETK